MRNCCDTVLNSISCSIVYNIIFEALDEKGEGIIFYLSTKNRVYEKFEIITLKVRGDA